MPDISALAPVLVSFGSLVTAAAAALAWAKERGRADDLEDANTELLKANRELREERDTATGAYRELKRAVIAKAPAKRKPVTAA